MEDAVEELKKTRIKFSKTVDEYVEALNEFERVLSGRAEKLVTKSEQPKGDLANGAVAEELEEIDLSCKCTKCEERIKEFYHLHVTCCNCGWKGKAKIRKGDSPLIGAECPNCKVSYRLQYGNDLRF